MPSTPVEAALSGSASTATTRVWFVYLMECRGARLYCGITPDLAARFDRHRDGTGAAFTRMHPPLRMLAALPCESRAAASRVEAATKKLGAAAKRALAAGWPLRDGLPAGPAQAGVVEPIDTGTPQPAG
jgi:putative endonuclease